MSTAKAPGQPAPPGRLLRPEVIGPPECPLMHRWTLVSTAPIKLMVHHFLPNADDRAVHDHPRPLWTFVLSGGYDDMDTCKDCEGRGGRLGRSREFKDRWLRCGVCGGRGVVLRERMRAGMLRYRPASHRHRTRVLSTGAWTIVLMGPVAEWWYGAGRPEPKWGFWKDGRWMFWRDHEERYGFGMRCGDEDVDLSVSEKADLLAALAAEGASRCCYMPGAGNPAAWPTARCDCKFFDPFGPPKPLSTSSEQTGCCEMRAAYRVLADEIGAPHS